MSRNWTKNQKQAIDAKGGSVIVSAAAGSGKTAVLVERVISSLIDKEKPVDADRILVVTYTRAAAAELKERLSNKINELLKNDPFNKNLLRQKSLLSKANISTIDSFCSSIVKEFFYILNIERNFRIADESELSLLKKDALKLTLDSMYADAEPDFFHLVEAFGSVKDDTALQDNILKIHEFLRSHPYPDLWIDKKLEMFTDFTDVNTSVWSKIINEYAIEAVEFLYSVLDHSYSMLDCEQELCDKLLPLLDSDRQFVDDLKLALLEPAKYSVCTAVNMFEKGRFPTVKGYTDNYYKLVIQRNRGIFSDIVSKLKAILSYTDVQSKTQIADLYVVSLQLFNCVRQFSSNYQKLKAEKKIADFPDLLHWTIKLLVDENTYETTDIAKKLQSRFDEIMVDEYQDANEAQDLIFDSLSRNGENLFFVGDVKQSIYGFRQAMPQLFLNRKNKSFLYDEDDLNYPAKIYLDKNFRSINGVIDCVNFFFEKLMSQSVGDIVYDETESLKCGATYDDLKTSAVSYHLLDLSDIENADMRVEEAKHIADTILKMISQGYKVKDGDSYRNATYSDFAVLMRNANKHAPVYVDTLNVLGVPSYCESSYSFLNSPEIMVMTNFLSIIDNPALDIELLSVMMSPIFSFSADDMALIRCDDKYVNLYKAVLSKAEKGNNKCIGFINELKYYRDISVTTDVASLLDILYERTGYISIVSALPNSEIAVNNLLLLKEYAKNYENGVGRGLSRFVNYLSRLKQNKSDLSGAKDVTTATKNAVRVMSIHSSKGLEFPVCIVANTARKFVSDVSQNVLLHSQLGIALKQKDDDTNTTFSTMPREALSLSIKRDEMSEELRVLYVAMTRAKQKLILLSSHEKLEAYLSKISSNLVSNKVIPPFVVRNCTLLSEWLTMCAMLHPDGALLREIASCDIQPDMSAKFTLDIKVVRMHCDDEEDQNISEISEHDLSDTDDLVVNTLKDRVCFKYKNAALSKLPSKISASDLSHKLSDKAFDKILDTPAFMSDSTLTPAQRGTALHAFMQFCDFEKARADIETEITRLCDIGFISKIQADSIDRVKAKNFVNSDLVSRCIKSDKVYKEYRFTIKVNASLVDSTLDKEHSDKKIILQGAVDLAFVEDGELVIVDYKTDRVKDINELSSIYHHQLEIYKEAMEQCTDYKVKECLIYSLYLSDSTNIM